MPRLHTLERRQLVRSGHALRLSEPRSCSLANFRLEAISGTIRKFSPSSSYYVLVFLPVLSVLVSLLASASQTQEIMPPFIPSRRHPLPTSVLREHHLASHIDEPARRERVRETNTLRMEEEPLGWTPAVLVVPDNGRPQRVSAVHAELVLASGARPELQPRAHRL